jgi:hypothetical protein
LISDTPSAAGRSRRAREAIPRGSFIIENDAIYTENSLLLSNYLAKRFAVLLRLGCPARRRAGARLSRGPDDFHRLNCQFAGQGRRLPGVGVSSSTPGERPGRWPGVDEQSNHSDT